MSELIQRTAIILLLLLTVCACSNGQINRHNNTTPTSEHRNPQPVQADYRPDLFPEQAIIPFGESRVQPLETGAPPAGAKLIRRCALLHSEAEILVYSSIDSSPDLTGYLKGTKSQWKLGHLSAPNGNKVGINPLNFITGEVTGAAIEIPFGSIGAQNGLLVYHQNTDSWKVMDFEGHGAISMDLDGNGVPEWVGNQTDWVPPAHEIHHWDQSIVASNQPLYNTQACFLIPPMTHLPTPPSLWREGNTSLKSATTMPTPFSHLTAGA